MSKYKEMLREAKWTVATLVVLIIFWLLAGILGSRVEMEIFNIPMWAVFGTLGVWLFAIIVAVNLSSSIKDSEL